MCVRAIKCTFVGGFFFDILLGKDGAYIISIRHSDDGRLFKVFFFGETHK